MIIRKAGEDDIPSAHHVLHAASQWLAARGYDQWQRRPITTEHVRMLVNAGSMYVGTLDNRIVATMAVDKRADPDFWEPQDDPENALYLHKMAVNPEYRGHRLGEELTDYAAAKARAEGKKWLRLDAWRSNPDLQEYYRSRGWTHVRTVNAPHRDSGALFQRDAWDTPPDAL